VIMFSSPWRLHRRQGMLCWVQSGLCPFWGETRLLSALVLHGTFHKVLISEDKCQAGVKEYRTPSEQSKGSLQSICSSSAFYYELRVSRLEGQSLACTLPPSFLGLVTEARLQKTERAFEIHTSGVYVHFVSASCKTTTWYNMIQHAFEPNGTVNTLK
jgi:hypothetical protein